MLIKIIYIDKFVPGKCIMTSRSKSSVNPKPHIHTNGTNLFFVALPVEASTHPCGERKQGQTSGKLGVHSGNCTSHSLCTIGKPMPS